MKYKSILVKNQKIILPFRVYEENGQKYRIKATIRYDDECGNGHNTFTITCDIQRQNKNSSWTFDAGGCCHDEFKKHFPEHAHLIKWHLVSSDGPLHFIANTCYHASNRDFDAARSCGIWPEATDAHLGLSKSELEKLLLDRLPNLIDKFKKDIEAISLIF